MTKYKSEVKGKGGIVARVVADSMSPDGVRITTMELEYPRFILAELNTHRVFSRNSSSSRAIPVKKMIEQVRKNPAMPIHWGANKPGMQADDECTSNVEFDWLAGQNKGKEPWDAWQEAADRVCDIAEAMSKAGYHKQVVNRLLEPFQFMKTVVTSTEWDNFFELRAHPDAQPEIQELANCMKSAMEESIPSELKYNQWHVPYVEIETFDDGSFAYFLPNDHTITELTEEQALMVSASCCAQVSYRVLDGSLNKAKTIYDKLVTSKPGHYSPLEHQAKPMRTGRQYPCNKNCWDEGATHASEKGRGVQLWSGNIRGWVQYRQTIMNNADG